MIWSEIGWAKYILLKPFLGTLKEKSVVTFSNQAKITVFTTWLKSSGDIPPEKQEALIKAYAAQFSPGG